MSKSFNIFASLVKWQNYVHYALLTFIIAWYLQLVGIEKIFTLLVVIFVADTMIHAGFALAPKPIQWRD